MPTHIPTRLWQASAALLCLLLLAGCSSLPNKVERIHSRALAQPQMTVLGQQVEHLRTQAQTPYRSGFSLLDGADAAFTSRLALVEGATHTLDLQYYAIHADASTARLLRAIVQAAQRGVRVRVLLDDFHGAGSNAQVMRLAFVPGVEMRMFNPLTGPRASTLLRALSTVTDFQRAQQRMHNKLFIADNAVGIAGGRNLGDAYFDALDNNNFIDLDVMAAGAVVKQLSSSFDRYWNDSRAYPVSALVSEKKLRQMAAVNTSTDAEATSPTAFLQPMDLRSVPWVWAPAIVLVDSPEKIPAPPEDTAASLQPYTLDVPPIDSAPLWPTIKPSGNQQTLRKALVPLVQHDNVVSGLLALMDHAQQDILVVSPYFVPGQDMKDAFARARARGVRLRVLTNSLASNDAPLAHAGYARHREELLHLGVELYEMRSVQHGQADKSTLRSNAAQISGSQGRSRAMLHSKLLVIDHKLTVVGSMNLDLRSQLQNTEVALLVASRQLAHQSTAFIENSLQDAYWQVIATPQGLVWIAPANSNWAPQTSEPDASLPLRLMIQLVGPFAPDEML